MPTINLRGAQKNYGVNSANAVSDLDLEIRDGEFMCLLGPSGCGKTTTLRMIAGLENLSGGEIRVGDRVIDSVTDGIFVPPEKREMGLVFQSYALWPHLTIERNTDFGLRLRKLPKAEREARVERVMQALDIAKYRDRYPSQLSGGQQQRVALARSLVLEPKILLLDEPFASLDQHLRERLREEVRDIQQRLGITTLFVTHGQDEALSMADRIVVMANGRTEQIDRPNVIYREPQTPFVAGFIGTMNLIEGMVSGGNFTHAGLTVPLPVSDGPAILAIRPEAVDLTASE
ncbi:MAG: ABC transporter ATP-binding protein, partial [Agrobacterium sp.]|uniref:ABC transporter ATP-binding protein n=1 Tax=Agrobacterium sp. TaxID=361 RepID=UPI004034DCBD